MKVHGHGSTTTRLTASPHSERNAVSRENAGRFRRILRHLPGPLLIVPLLIACGIASDAVAQRAEKVRTWEETLTLPTYPWFEDPHPAFSAYEDVIYYPYSREDHIGKTSAPREYRTVCLENEYLRVTCIPELGGRIHSVLVKATGEEMFHRNDVIKPALIAMRGAWIGGGIEWNPGPHGHTVTILSPVDVLVREHRDGSATLVVSNTEQIFRTRWTVRLTLHPGRAYLDEEISLYNPTDSVAPYYFWNCTAFPNLEGTRFIYPMTLGTDHSGTEFFRWPVHEGRDLRWLKNYDTMTSVFAYKCEFDFFGAYDVDRDKGIVSYANHRELPGKKAWTWGKDDFGIVSQMALSDAGPIHAQYIEVQSGPLLTQSDYGMLKPGHEIRWREFWYPVHGLGDGFEYATRHGAVQTTREGGTVTVRLLTTTPYSGARCVISSRGRVLFEKRLNLGPEAAFALALEDVPEGPLDITLKSARGELLLGYTTPLDIPVVDPPETATTPVAEASPEATEAVYAKAFLLHSQSSLEAAREAYLEVIAGEPRHVPALCGLATLALNRADFEGARAYAEQATGHDENSGDAWYLQGAAQLHLGAYQDAATSGYKASLALDRTGRGHYLTGRAEMHLGKYKAAADAFARTLEANPNDTQARNARAAALIASGDARKALELTAEALARDPADFALRAVAAMAADDGDAVQAFIRELTADSGEHAFTVQEVACFLADLGMYARAATLLDSALVLGMDDVMMRYYAAWLHHRAGDEDAARVHIMYAENLSTQGVMPARTEALGALEYVVAIQPESSGARLLLGHVLAHFNRLDEAAVQWREAAERDASLCVAWRLLALHAWQREKDLDAAENHLRKATAACPEDQLLYRDLTKLLGERGRRQEGIEVIEAMPRTRDVRYDVYLWLAQAYLDEERFDDCIELLAEARFSNWEGNTTPHDIFVAALNARGKLSFEAGALDAALADFERALTFPENLEVGARYELTDAETRYWLGKTLLALGRSDDAVRTWGSGANQRRATDPKLPFIRITKAQDEHVAKCRTAMEVLSIAVDREKTAQP